MAFIAFTPEMNPVVPRGQPSIPQVTVGTNGRFVFSTAASKALDDDVLVKYEFDKPTGAIAITGVKAVPKGAAAKEWWPLPKKGKSSAIALAAAGLLRVMGHPYKDGAVVCAVTVEGHKLSFNVKKGVAKAINKRGPRKPKTEAEGPVLEQE